jgi:hypothetical protein
VNGSTLWAIVVFYQEWLQLGEKIPVFDLARNRIFRRAYESTALEAGILSWIKYYWGISEANIIDPFIKVWSEEIVRASLTNLVQAEQVIRVRGNYYYRYSPMTAREMKEYVGGECIDETWDKVRTLQHPLYVRSMRLARREFVSEVERLASGRKIVVRSADSDDVIWHAAQEAFQKTGSFGLLAAGAQISRTQDIVDKYAQENSGLRVYRKDGEYQFKDGSRGPSVEYVCWDPIKELKLRFG